MTNPVMDKVTYYVAGLGALLALGAFALGGPAWGLGALVGALVAVANWIALKWIGSRVMGGSVKKRGALMVLLALKMGALFVLCWLLLARYGLHPVGFMLGISAFAGGILAAAFRTIAAGEHAEAEASGEGEG